MISLASVISMAWVPGRGATNSYNFDIPWASRNVGAPRKSLPQGASGVVTPLKLVWQRTLGLVEFLITVYCKFANESASERILKIG